MKNASKILCLICLSTSLALADEATPTASKSGAFVGVEAGYNMQFSQTATTEAGTNQAATTTNTSKATTFPFATLGLKAGYGYFFNKYIGLRAYGSYHYGVSTAINTTIEPGTGGGGGGANTATETKSTATSSSHQVAANIEVVYDFVTLDNFSSGIYAGVGVGYGSFSTASTADNTKTIADMGSGFVLPVNVGLEFGFAKHHRASLNFRIPTIAATTKINTPEIIEYRSRQLIMTLGYAFVF